MKTAQPPGVIRSRGASQLTLPPHFLPQFSSDFQKSFQMKVEEATVERHQQQQQQLQLQQQQMMQQQQQQTQRRRQAAAASKQAERGPDVAARPASASEVAEARAAGYKDAMDGIQRRQQENAKYVPTTASHSATGAMCDLPARRSVLLLLPLI